MSKRSSITYAGKANFFVLYQSVKLGGKGSTLKEKAIMSEMVRKGINGMALVITGERMQDLLREHDEIFTFEGENATRGWRGNMPYLRVMEIIEPYLLKAVPIEQKWNDLPKIGLDRSAAWEQISCAIVSEVTGLEFRWTGIKKTEHNGYYPDGIHGENELFMEAKGCQSVFSCRGAITVKQGKCE